MHLLLTDRLCCPRCGPDFGLILLAQRVEDRRVFEGDLGCANCRETFPVSAGFGDLRLSPREPLREPSPPPDPPSEEDDVRMAALMGVIEGPGHMALLGQAAVHAAGLADMLDGVEVVGVGALLRGASERAGVSRLVSGSRLPFYSRSLRAVALDDSTPDRVREAVRVTAPGGRVVVLDADATARESLEAEGMTIVLDGEGVVVGHRPSAPGGTRGTGVPLPVFPRSPGPGD